MYTPLTGTNQRTSHKTMCGFKNKNDFISEILQDNAYFDYNYTRMNILELRSVISDEH